MCFRAGKADLLDEEKRIRERLPDQGADLSTPGLPKKHCIDYSLWPGVAAALHRRLRAGCLDRL